MVLRVLVSPASRPRCADVMSLTEFSARVFSAVSAICSESRNQGWGGQTMYHVSGQAQHVCAPRL